MTQRPNSGLHDNDENLAGFAAAPSAVLSAFVPVPPTKEEQTKLVDYRQVSDPDTGITIEYKCMADEFTSQTYQFMECNYGFQLGEKEALKRIEIAANS